jgi:UDP-N-acetylmuramyl pentapeptide phosphotransferase/UDP-N-acetylglucosamine-1-phosphate transferase
MSLYSPLAAFFVALISIAAILSSRLGGKIQDIPNERSLHSMPTPRVGGLGLMAGVLAGWGLMFQAWVWWIVVPLLVLAAVSFFDDIHNLPVKLRLLAQLAAAACMVVGAGVFGAHGILLALLLTVAVVWMINLYNFMDGSNGLAGGMALFGFAFYGIAALMVHQESFALMNFCISAAAAGFLYFNFPSARVFMGDAGSIPLGFLAAAMGLWGWQQGCWAAWFPLLVFSPFVVDASMTLFRRALRGAKVTEAHREHYYQRTIQMGWSHRRLAFVEYGLMLGSGAAALLGMSGLSIALPLVVCVTVYVVLMVQVDAAWKRHVRGQHA